MILNPQQRNEFEEAATPLIKWLNLNCYPHVMAIVEPGRAQLTEGVYSWPTDEYTQD